MTIQKIEERITFLKKQNKKLFIPYLMCGDGGFEKTKSTLRLLEDSGASIIEIGIPFSDPIADGPVIQAAGQRALNDGITLEAIMTFLKTDLPQNNVPRILMSYLNPILQYGYEAFFKDMDQAQISGIIIPDLPLEEYDAIVPFTSKNKIALIPLVAPSTDLNRLDKILSKTSGFIYTVTINGTTGERQTFSEDVLDRLATIKAHSPMPLVAGFGVSTLDHVKNLSQHCDGVVVGSKIVDYVHRNELQKLKSFVEESCAIDF